ncbi:MAG: MarR family transcriptional regulator [Chloroflexota bacterium]
MNRHNDTSSLDNATAYIMLRASRLLRFHLDKVLERAGVPISPEQWFILFKLWENPGLPQNALTDPVLNDEPNIARLVRSLMHHGYVERVVDETDRRRKLVSLTEKGEALMQHMFPIVVETREQVFGGIPADELERFVELLHRVEENVIADLERDEHDKPVETQ